MVSGRTAAALWVVASRTCSILLAAFLCSCRQAFFPIRLVSVHVVYPYSSIDTTAAWKKLRFILSIWSDFHMTNSLSISVHAFVSCVSMSFSVDETLLPWWVNLSTSFRELPLSVKMSPVWLKHLYSVLYALTWRPIPAAARSRLCSRVSAWVDYVIFNLTKIGNISCKLCFFNWRTKYFRTKNLLSYKSCLRFHHHHHVALIARISLTLSRHSSLSFIAQGRSSGQHPVSSHSCWMYVRAGRPAFARPCVGVHKSTSLMSSSLLQFLDCLEIICKWFSFVLV